MKIFFIIILLLSQGVDKMSHYKEGWVVGGRALIIYIYRLLLLIAVIIIMYWKTYEMLIALNRHVALCKCVCVQRLLITSFTVLHLVAVGYDPIISISNTFF